MKGLKKNNVFTAFIDCYSYCCQLGVFSFLLARDSEKRWKFATGNLAFTHLGDSFICFLLVFRVRSSQILLFRKKSQKLLWKYAHLSLRSKKSLVLSMNLNEFSEKLNTISGFMVDLTGKRYLKINCYYSKREK